MEISEKKMKVNHQWLILKYKNCMGDPSYHHKFISLDHIKRIKVRPDGLCYFYIGEEVFFINGIGYDDINEALTNFNKYVFSIVTLKEYQRDLRLWEE